MSYPNFFLLLLINICWRLSKLYDPLVCVLLFLYRFCGTILLLLGCLLWASTNYFPIKGGVMWLQIIIALMPLCILFLAKMVKKLPQNNDHLTPTKLLHRSMLFITGVLSPLGVLARKIIELDTERKAARKYFRKKSN